MDSLSEVLALEDDSQLRALVEAACQEEGVVMAHPGGDYVMVQTVRELIEELVVQVRESCPNEADSAWLALIMKVLITYQVRANLYDARARASFKLLVNGLGGKFLPWSEVVAIERALTAEYSALISDNDSDPQSCQSVARYLKVAVAAVGGGALMMYTGSVAAPSIAASLIALCTAGGSLTQLSTSAAALLSYWGLSSEACISSLFAATGVGVTGYKMSQRTRGVTEFHFVPLHSNFPLDIPRHRYEKADGVDGGSARDEEQYYGGTAGNNTGNGTGGLPVFVCIPGWVEEDQDPRLVWGGATTTVSSSSTAAGKEEPRRGGGDWEDEMIDAVEDEDESPMAQSMDSLLGSWEALDLETSGWWREVVPSGEEHVLIWETQVLGQLHRAMKEFVWNEASKYAIDEVIKHTALASLTTAAALPMTVLDAARKLDNPWQMAVFHAQEAGQLLANILASRPQGSRPVTLIGYSMGARVIFHCLEALYDKMEAGLGIVENAVLLGAPIGRNPERWKKARTVVAGRLINGYSTRDWVLMFLFRSKSWELGLAGISPVDGGFVENADLTDMVPGHLLYPKALPNIMAKLRLEE